MIKPQPFELKCTQCGWSKTFAPASDVLHPGQDLVASCPKCGNEELEHKAVGAVKGLLAEIREQLKAR
ncbi:MAG: hypothetical protein GX029_05920 [Pseudomonadaceae bacterium]|nr:hypothetical protein [Pseudomonadaceae bacterium]